MRLNIFQLILLRFAYSFYAGENGYFSKIIYTHIDSIYSYRYVRLNIILEACNMNPKMNTANLLAILILFLLSVIFSGCISNGPDASPAIDSEQSVSQELRLSTTTSTCDAGLLDVLNKRFEGENDVKILTICQGTGKAIATGELGGADVVMVHAPSSELKAVANGSFINRSYMMYNYFVIIGPASDPAGIRNSGNATDAFAKIAAKPSPFISRGDDSGTHKKEKSIWTAANITPSGEWYQSVGKGMGETITTSDIKEGYTLSDRGTYLFMKEKIQLEVLFESDKTYLFNPYHVMAVNPQKYQNVKYDLALEYIKFVTSEDAIKIIGNYGIDKYGEALFVPAEDADT